MATSLPPEAVLSRRRNDHVLLDHLDRSDCPIRVSGHRTAADARADRGALAVGQGIPPGAYRATFEFDTLIGPGRRHRPTHMVIDPLANGDYPASEPVANVIGEAPWAPHFTNGRPACHGHRLWVPNGTQLVDYVIHLGRLLNFDEPPPDATFSAYNGAAVEWWRKNLNYGPLDPNLHFPVIEPTAILAKPTSRLRGTTTAAAASGSRLRGHVRPSGSRLRPAQR